MLVHNEMAAPCTKGSTYPYHTTSATPPWPDSVLQINPLPEHFASISKVLGEMLKDPGFKKFWGCRKGVGALFLAGLGYHILRPENIEGLVPIMPLKKRQVVQQMKNRLLLTSGNDTDVNVVAPRQQNVQ